MSVATVVGGGARGVGYQQITLGAAVKALTLPPGADAPTYALIEPETQAVRWRDDGTDPTALIGQPLAVGESLQYNADLSAIRFFEQVSGAVLNGTYCQT
jgi:hypothetical protein